MLREMVQEISAITEWKGKSAVTFQVFKEPPTLSQIATLFHGVHGPVTPALLGAQTGWWLWLSTQQA